MTERRRTIERTAEHGKQGFTLIEILLVVAIIGILAALAAPKLTGKAQKAKITAASVDIKNIGTALDLYELDMGAYPPSLQALIANPGGGEQWNGPYLKSGMPKDPWKRDYIYSNGGQAGYSLKSLGPDGVDSGDDVSNKDPS
ncbi:MAG: type II secretion system major pseudopilin GspG [Verrucomicrobiota bacterium]